MKGHAVHRTPFHYNWYARLDSNQRLSAPEADALSPELRAHTEGFERRSILSKFKAGENFIPEAYW